MPASKTDKVETLKRVELCVKALLRGTRVPILSLQLQEKYGVSESQTYRYIKEATVQIHAKIDGKLEERINKHYNMLEELYREAMREEIYVNPISKTKSVIKSPDLKAARQVLKDISDLFGYDSPKRTDITSGGETIAPRYIDVLGTAGHIVKPREEIKEHDGTSEDNNLATATNTPDSGTTKADGVGGDGEASESTDSDPKQGS